MFFVWNLNKCKRYLAKGDYFLEVLKRASKYTTLEKQQCDSLLKKFRVKYTENHYVGTRSTLKWEWLCPTHLRDPKIKWVVEKGMFYRACVICWKKKVVGQNRKLAMLCNSPICKDAGAEILTKYGTVKGKYSKSNNVLEAIINLTRKPNANNSFFRRNPGYVVRRDRCPPIREIELCKIEGDSQRMPSNSFNGSNGHCLPKASERPHRAKDADFAKTRQRS